MFALAAVVAIPLVAYLYFKRGLIAFVVSAPCGAIVTIGKMLYDEVKDPRGDIDFVFQFACVFWAFVVTCVYAAFFVIASVIRRMFA
jgi:hypothetical protein